MKSDFKNLVFAGGGILGIAYLGLLDYFYQNNLMTQVERVAGASSGAITACIASFNLPFEEVKTITNSMDYSQVPGKDETLSQREVTGLVKGQLNKIFDNIDCVYRLIKKFGWYSSNYFYDWIKGQIATQFDATKKTAPYTFSDFKDAVLHKEGRVFKDLYIVGTDVSNSTSSVFSYESTPNMEVAEAVRISMSVPLFFEAIKSNCENASPKSSPRLYSDGGIMYSYPINIFDEQGPLSDTLGSLFTSTPKYVPINNLLDFIAHVLSCSSTIQFSIYKNNPDAVSRSIEINTFDVNALDFNVKPNDEVYEFLYKQGYIAAENYFLTLNNPSLNQK